MNLPIPSKIKYVIHDLDQTTWTKLWDKPQIVGLEEDVIILLDEDEELCVMSQDYYRANFVDDPDRNEKLF